MDPPDFAEGKPPPVTVTDTDLTRAVANHDDRRQRTGLVHKSRRKVTSTGRIRSRYWAVCGRRLLDGLPVTTAAPVDLCDRCFPQPGDR